MIRRTFAVLAIVAIAAASFSLGTRSAEAQADIPVGTSGFEFSLMDLEGNTHTLADYLADGKVVVLEWYNPGCPVVQKYYEGGNGSMREAKAFAAEHDVVWLAVNSGAPGKQGHGVEVNAESAADWGIDNPILLDESGDVGRMFRAQNTPQLFIISPDNVLLYNGGVDASRVDGDAAGQNYVINALTQYMAGEEVNPSTTAHPGCSVKYGEKPQDAMEPSTAQGGR